MQQGCHTLVFDTTISLLYLFSVWTWEGVSLSSHFLFCLRKGISEGWKCTNAICTKPRMPSRDTFSNCPLFRARRNCGYLWNLKIVAAAVPQKVHCAFWKGCDLHFMKNTVAFCWLVPGALQRYNAIPSGRRRSSSRRRRILDCVFQLPLDTHPQNRFFGSLRERHLLFSSSWTPGSCWHPAGKEETNVSKGNSYWESR